LEYTGTTSGVLYKSSSEIKYRDCLYVQDMERGGALENLSTVETVKILVDAYRSSDAAYNATEKIQSLSKKVISIHTSFLVFSLESIIVLFA